jgi:hypothetical protein
MYLRPIRLTELIDWLDANEYDDLEVDDLAQRLFDKFEILTYSTQAT